jgi:class 3 adenylate cyclase
MLTNDASAGPIPIENHLRESNNRWTALQKSGTAGSLLLIDLSGSTAFKTKHPESVWLPRLQHFYEAVGAALPVGAHRKFLGDGILVFLPLSVARAEDVAGLADGLLNVVAAVSDKHGYVGDYALRCRVVLDFGTVYLIGGIDPQGTPVDRLFRAEKFVPPGCVGYSAAFRDAAQSTAAFSIGSHYLRGISDERQELFLSREPLPQSEEMVDDVRERSALEDVWGLGSDPAEPVYVVSGQIPLKETEPYAVHSGDKDAVVLVACCLARVGKIDAAKFLTSSEFSEHFYRSNVICVGGPDFNSVCERFLAECPSRLTFQYLRKNCKLYDGRTGYSWNVVRRRGKVIKDVGFFAKLRNPYNDRSEIILLCGIETYGVLGAAKLLSGRENNPSFFQLYESISAALPARCPRPRDFYVVSEFGVELSGAIRHQTLSDQVAGLRSHLES